MPHHDGIKPAASSLATGRGAELVADRSEVVADLVLEFGGHGAVADPGDVGLGDANDLVHVTGVDAGAMGGVPTEVTEEVTKG